MTMDAGEAFRIADEHVADPELDALFTELLRVPSVHTERMEADPALKAFVADVVAPRIAALTGIAPRADGMGNLRWQLGGVSADPAEGLLFMGYAMTYPAGSMPEPFSGEVVPGEPYGLRRALHLGPGWLRAEGGSGGHADRPPPPCAGRGKNWRDRCCWR